MGPRLTWSDYRVDAIGFWVGSKDWERRNIIGAKYSYAKSIFEIGKPTMELVNFLEDHVSELYFDSEDSLESTIEILQWEKGSLPVEIKIVNTFRLHEYGADSSRSFFGFDWANYHEILLLRKVLVWLYDETSRLRADKIVAAKEEMARKEKTCLTLWLEDLGYGKEAN